MTIRRAVTRAIALLAATALPLSVYAQIGQCQVVGDEFVQTEGDGCCDSHGDECDYYVVSYDSSCSGSCPVGQVCKEVGWQLFLVYEYQDCYGNCSGCTLGDLQGWSPCCASATSRPNRRIAGQIAPQWSRT